MLAVVTVAALVTGVSAAPIPMDDTGSVKGRVFATDSRTPLVGATVKAAHLASETVFESAPADADGRFVLADLPSGSYELAIATEEGLYPTRQTFLVEGGGTRVLSLAVAMADDEDEGDGNDEGDDEGDDEGEDDDEGGFWDRTGVATGTILGLAFAFGYAADEILGDSEQPKEVFSSASSP
jgi:hypothetical protein